MKTKDLETVNAELQEKKEAVDNVNFKMVTFSLGGKDYGVDIMNVKEIAKADKYTFVPNAASFVRGVYNLRGEIIPIIDLRLFFHLPATRSENNLDNMLILHIEDRVYGTIVDKIDKVVGINNEQIQPPHPIFGDINIKYISGVVEKHGSLYIILDVIRIFSQSQQEKDAPRGQMPIEDSTYYPAPTQSAVEDRGFSDENLSFIKEQLGALKKFYSSSVNEDWIKERLVEWGKDHKGEEVQLKTQADAEKYLVPFYSPFNGAFWNSGFAYNLKAILPDMPSNNIQVWNPGCGKGFETFSLACILKLRYPDGHIKIWANDSDILSIANAPNMSFSLNDVSDYCQTFLSKGRNGYQFNATIKDSIIFEYHDITIENTLPQLDIIVIMDTLSFLPESGQAKVLSDISEKLKNNGVLIVGTNEKMAGTNWKFIGKDQIQAYIHING